jgi:D-3-phosphoglycerate dehydrogenase
MKVLLSSRSFGERDTEALEMLSNAGLKYILNPHGRKLSENEIIELCDEEVNGILAGTETISRAVMESAPSLKVISRYGVGLDNVDLKAADELGIIVKNTPEAPSLAVAELALTLILDSVKKISFMDRNIRSSKWKPIMGNNLTGKTIGIIGLGRIGRALAKLLEPFEPKVLALENNPDEEFNKKYNIEIASLEKIITESDIITLHLPLTEETRNTIGKNELSQMKNSAIIVNTARGGLIDEGALIDALENENIAGAALDVFEEEPYEGRLKEFDTVVLSPHVGSLTAETRRRMGLETVENLINTLKELKLI